MLITNLSNINTNILPLFAGQNTKIKSQIQIKSKKSINHNKSRPIVRIGITK